MSHAHKVVTAANIRPGGCYGGVPLWRFSGWEREAVLLDARRLFTLTIVFCFLRDQIELMLVNALIHKCFKEGGSGT